MNGLTGDSVLDSVKTQTAQVASAPAAVEQDVDVLVGGGQKIQGPFAGEIQGRQRPKTPPVTIKASAIQDSILALGANLDPQYDAVAGLLVAGDFLKPEYVKYPAYTSNSMGTAINLHAAYVKNGGDRPLMEWLDWYARNRPQEADAPSAARAGAYTGPVTTTTTTLTDEVTAEALLNQVSRDLLGRSLTKKETQKYLNEFRQAEEGAPQVTTTTPGGPASRETETVTAADKGELLRQILVENPDYQKYQVDTTIMDLLMEDIDEGKKVIYGGLPR